MARLLTLVMIALLSCTDHALAQGVLPRLIDGPRLDPLVRALGLDEAEIQKIARVHQEYMKSWSEQFDGDILRYNAARSAAYSHPNDNAKQASNHEAAMREANEITASLAGPLEAANDAFLAQVQATVPEEKHYLIHKFRLAQQRLQYNRGNIGVREKHIDVIDLLGEMDLSGEDWTAIETVLADFEPRFIAALQDAARADQNRSVPEMRSYDLLILRGEADSPEVQAAIDAERRKLADQAGRSSVTYMTRLAEVNREGLRLLQGVLSPDAGAEFQRRYDERAYPEIYPDPTSAEPMYDVLGRNPGPHGRPTRVIGCHARTVHSRARAAKSSDGCSGV